MEEKRLANITDECERTRQANLARRLMFGKWDKAIDTMSSGPRWLGESSIASLTADAIAYLNGRKYTLDTYCIMPNHVHILYTPLEKADGLYHSLSSIQHSLKRYIARQANQVLGREGEFWQHENYDHVVRSDEELGRIVNYILDNPVKAGLCANRADWPWSYSKHAM